LRNSKISTFIANWKQPASTLSRWITEQEDYSESIESSSISSYPYSHRSQGYFYVYSLLPWLPPSSYISLRPMLIIYREYLPDGLQSVSAAIGPHMHPSDQDNSSHPLLISTLTGSTLAQPGQRPAPLTKFTAIPTNSPRAY
jgi:hypothetical protein